MRAAKQGCKEAEEILKELEEKNILPAHLKKNKERLPHLGDAIQD